MIRGTLALLARMLRVRVAITMWTFMLLGVARHATPSVGWDLALATIALAASYVTATTLNDLMDAAIDAVNRPLDRGRPLVVGDAGRTELWRTYGVATTLAVGAAVPLGAPGVTIVGSSLLLSYAYSGAPFRLSRRWSLAPLVLTAAYVVVPYALGVSLTGETWDARDLPLVAGLVVLFFARIVLKDFRDRLGDEAFGKRTLLARIGKDATCRLAMAGAVIGSGISIMAIGPSIGTAIVLGAAAVGIVWQLDVLRRATDPTREQIAIGIAARIGNGLLCGCLAWLLLQSAGASRAEATAFVITLGVVFAVATVPLAAAPATVRIGYKPFTTASRSGSARPTDPATSARSPSG